MPDCFLVGETAVRDPERPIYFGRRPVDTRVKVRREYAVSDAVSAVFQRGFRIFGRWRLFWIGIDMLVVTVWFWRRCETLLGREKC